MREKKKGPSKRSQKGKQGNERSLEKKDGNKGGDSGWSAFLDKGSKSQKRNTQIPVTLAIRMAMQKKKNRKTREGEFPRQSVSVRN